MFEIYIQNLLMLKPKFKRYNLSSVRFFMVKITYHMNEIIVE